MADAWLTGKIINVNVDRDTAFSISLPAAAGVVLSNPVVDIERIRTNGFSTVISTMRPTVTLVGGVVKMAFSAVQGGLMHDLVDSRLISRFRYRMRAQADGGTLRTFVAGKISVGPIGFGEVQTNLVLPIQVNTGNIVVGDVTVVDVPDVPVDSGDTLANTSFWATDIATAWAASVYVTWA